MDTGTPVNDWPSARVTVTVVVDFVTSGGVMSAVVEPFALNAPPRPRPPRPPAPPLTQRDWSVGGSYFPPIPARSPVGEWHVLHLPAPLKYASPFFASPTTIFK